MKSEPLTKDQERWRNMSEEQKAKKRQQAAERMRKLRENMSQQQKAEKRQQAAERMRTLRENMSEQQKAKKRQQAAESMRKLRAARCKYQLEALPSPDVQDGNISQM